MEAKLIGKWTFIVGAIIAIITGIGAGLNQGWADNVWVAALLVLAGLIVGVVNITATEVEGFLIAAMAILIANTANLTALIPGVESIGAILAGIVAKALLLIAPAALIVALRASYGFVAEQ